MALKFGTFSLFNVVEYGGMWFNIVITTLNNLQLLSTILNLMHRPLKTDCHDSHDLLGSTLSVTIITVLFF